MTDEVPWANQGTKNKWKGAPTEELLSTRSNLVVGITMLRCNVLVLTQSCDLDDVARDPNRRILVAAALTDEDPRFTAAFSAGQQSTAEEFVDDMISNAGRGKVLDAEAVSKAGADLEKPRKNALEDLWLGKNFGAFPLAADRAANIRRSVCYFDNVISLPSSWMNVLIGGRVLRLDLAWSSVLQEALAQWLGRFAYPGSKAERLSVGSLGAKEATSNEPPTSATADAKEKK